MTISTTAFADGTGAGIQINGATVLSITASAITAPKFIGDGSGLSKILAARNILGKADSSTPVFIKTGYSSISVKADTLVEVNGTVQYFAVDTPVSMPSLVAGEDYSVWVKPDGSAIAVVDPYSSPAVAPVVGSRKIGGFHYSLVTPNTTPASGSFNTTAASPIISMVWNQSLVDDIAGINKYSLWDLKFRPKSDARGMVYVNGFWVDIYFTGTDHITNGTSNYNTNVASGTVLPKIPVIYGGSGTSTYTTFTWYEASEVAKAYTKRLITGDEFATATFGVTENQSLGGAATTIPLTTRQPGYTSRYGLEQATGHHLTWGAVAHGVAGTAWVAGAGRGQTFGTPYAALYGGGHLSTSYSGSRCSYWGPAPWNSSWNIGLRAASDHLQVL